MKTQIILLSFLVLVAAGGCCHSGERGAGHLKVYTFSTDLLFEVGTAKLREESRQALDAAAGEISQRYKDHPLKVYAHTSNDPRRTGSPEPLALTLRWAWAVTRYLRGRDLDNDIETIGMGDSRPVVRNRKVGGRKNRRIEIVVVERR